MERVDMGMIIDLRMTVKETILYQVLSSKSSKIVSKDEIYNALDGRGFVSTGPKELGALVSKLREKLENHGYKIHSHWKKGWSLEKVVDTCKPAL